MARLAQSAERKALNLVVVGSSPTVGALGRRVLRRQIEFGFRFRVHFGVAGVNF